MKKALNKFKIKSKKFEYDYLPNHASTSLSNKEKNE